MEDTKSLVKAKYEKDSGNKRALSMQKYIIPSLYLLLFTLRASLSVYPSLNNLDW